MHTVRPSCELHPVTTAKPREYRRKHPKMPTSMNRIRELSWQSSDKDQLPSRWSPHAPKLHATPTPIYYLQVDRCWQLYILSWVLESRWLGCRQPTHTARGDATQNSLSDTAMLLICPTPLSLAVSLTTHAESTPIKSHSERVGMRKKKLREVLLEVLA